MKTKQSAGLAIIYNGLILLGHTTGRGWYSSYGIPKGGIEDGEDKMSVAAKREKKKSHEIAEFYFGNIDVRHHLLRQSDPEQAIRDLAKKYYEQLRNLDLAKVSVYELLPIEHESRVLPKTGYYKGTPFYGSWDQRNTARLVFKDEMRKLCAQGSVNLIEWVDPLLNEKGELDFECMEKPKSVHLSRNSYPHWQGRKWSGLSENKPATLEDFFA